MPAILLDTGALYALADQDDAWHERVKSLLDQHHETLLVPVTVLPEACYLLNAHLGQEAERALLTTCASGELIVAAITTEDIARSVELLDLYADANLGFVDASVVALSERLNVRQIVTTDRRDFSLVRPRHCPAFELLP